MREAPAFYGLLAAGTVGGTLLTLTAVDPIKLLVLSARTPAALERMTEGLAQHLAEHPEQQLADLAHTLQVGRRVGKQGATGTARQRTLAHV